MIRLHTRFLSMGLIVLAVMLPACEYFQKDLVMEVTAIQFLEPVDGSVVLTVVVTGNVSSAGWDKPELVPVPMNQQPADGIYPFEFVAQPPPAGSAAAQVISPVEAKFSYQELPAGFTGVRVITATNEMESLYQPANLQVVLETISVELISNADGSLTVTAHGNVSSEGWTLPRLLPFQYTAAPLDGIYDFTFAAVPPASPAAALISPLSASFDYTTPPQDLKGVRIHASQNSLEQLP